MLIAFLLVGFAVIAFSTWTLFKRLCPGPADDRRPVTTTKPTPIVLKKQAPTPQYTFPNYPVYPPSVTSSFRDDDDGPSLLTTIIAAEVIEDVIDTVDSGLGSSDSWGSNDTSFDSDSW